MDKKRVLVFVTGLLVIAAGLAMTPLNRKKAPKNLSRTQVLEQIAGKAVLRMAKAYQAGATIEELEVMAQEEIAFMNIVNRNKE